MAAVRIPLKRYPLTFRAPWGEIVDGNLVLHLPQCFGRQPWSIPLSEVVLIDFESGRRELIEDPDGLVFERPLVISDFSTASDVLRRPNLLLLFRTPQRIPVLRRTAPFSNVRVSRRRSRDGAHVDGIFLRALDPTTAVRHLDAAGAEPVPSMHQWLSAHREVVTDPQRKREAHEVKSTVDRTKRNVRVGMLVTLLVLAAVWFAVRDHPGASFLVRLMALMVVLGANPLVTRLARRRRARGPGSDGTPPDR